MADRIDAMRAFMAVCDLNGFAAAARRLGVSASVVTRQVAALEQRLGVRLLQRTTRSVRLTDAGTRFLERTRRILAEIDEAERSAQDETAAPHGTLVVAAPLLFGRMHVAPIVSRLLGAYAGVSVDLQLSDRFANLVEDGVDVAVRIGELAASGLIARRLGQTRRVLVASPDYLRANGTPERPADLGRHHVIAFRAMAPMTTWLRQRPGDARVAIDVQPRLTTDSGDVAIAHALSGGGITAALSYQVHAALSSGALVEVLPAYAPQPVPIRAVFPTSRLLSGAVRAFVSLAEENAARWTFPVRC